MNIEEYHRWVNDGMENTARYDFPNLNKQSIVIDAGGFKGEWSQKIFNKYKCKIRIYEPVNSFAVGISSKFQGNDLVQVFPFGLAGETRKEMISTNGDAASIFGNPTEEIELVDVFEELYQNGIKKVDLMKINIEGGEYELLNRLIETHLIKDIDVIQVQFHDFVPGCDVKRNAIIDELRKTHTCSWSYLYVWEEWKRK